MINLNLLVKSDSVARKSEIGRKACESDRSGSILVLLACLTKVLVVSGQDLFGEVVFETKVQRSLILENKKNDEKSGRKIQKCNV